MDLSDLHVAVIVGREGSITAASVHLGMAPGTVSKAISRLEREAKVTLFERLARGMRPTEIGAAFLARASALDLAAEDLYAQLRDLRQSRAGTLRIGMGQGVPDECVLPVVTRLVERGVHVQLAGGMTDSLTREVATGELEFAVFGLSEPPESPLAWEAVVPDPMQPMAPRGHPLARPRRQVPWRELARARWVVTGRQTATFAEFERNFRERGVAAPEPTVLSRSSFRDVALARAIQALVLVPRSAARLHAASGLEPVSPAGGWQSRRSLCLVWREGGYLSPAAEHAMTLFRDLLRDKLGI